VAYVANNYEERLLAFVDLLGWSERIHQTTDDQAAFDIARVIARMLRQPAEEYREQIEHFAQLPEEFLAQLRREFNGPLTPAFTKASHFSDTIVLSCPAEASIAWVVFVPRVQRLCAELLRKEQLTRGAIVRGPLYHDDGGDIFGPALIDAHVLESKVAYYPRILIDDSALGCIEDERLRRFCRTVRTDKDGLRYLDILGSEAGPADEPRLTGGYEQQMLDSARGKLCGTNDPRIKAKLGWMVNYLTEVLDELGSSPRRD
jgi:hypothetical protein